MVLVGRFLFHCVTTPSVDGWLHPLNVLRDKHPALYQQHIQKYHGREYVLQKRIPIFNCLWNDVLFLSAVSPCEIVQALKYVGGNPSPLYFYLIGDLALEPENCLIYLYEHEDHQDIRQYVPYRRELIPQYGSLSDRTVEYYRQTIAKGEQPLLYRYVPHFLYRGAIYVGNSKLGVATAV